MELVAPLNLNPELFGIINEPVQSPFASVVNVPELESGWDVRSLWFNIFDLVANSTKFNKKRSTLKGFCPLSAINL